MALQLTRGKGGFLQLDTMVSYSIGPWDTAKSLLERWWHQYMTCRQRCEFGGSNGKHERPCQPSLHFSLCKLFFLSRRNHDRVLTGRALYITSSIRHLNMLIAAAAIAIQKVCSTNVSYLHESVFLLAKDAFGSEGARRACNKPWKSKCIDSVTQDYVTPVSLLLVVQSFMLWVLTWRIQKDRLNHILW